MSRLTATTFAALIVATASGCDQSPARDAEFQELSADGQLSVRPAADALAIASEESSEQELLELDNLSDDSLEVDVSSDAEWLVLEPSYVIEPGSTVSLRARLADGAQPDADVPATITLSPKTARSNELCYKLEWNGGLPTIVPAPCPPDIFCAHWTGEISGGTFGKSDDIWHDIELPLGYRVVESFLEKRGQKETPNVYIKEAPAAGAMGVVNVLVHVGLSGGFSPEKIDYRACVRATDD